MRGPEYKILVLHAISGDTRKTVLDHAYCYPAYRAGNLYVYHHLLAPVTPELTSFPFDAVIINYCFLAYRVVDEWYPDLKNKYSFLSHAKAVKIAISQDDYTWNEVLDEWLEYMRVDVIYSPITRDLEVLYPRCSRRVPIKHALTGYANSKDLARLNRFVRPFAERRSMSEPGYD